MRIQKLARNLWVASYQGQYFYGDSIQRALGNAIDYAFDAHRVYIKKLFGSTTVPSRESNIPVGHTSDNS